MAHCLEADQIADKSYSCNWRLRLLCSHDSPVVFKNMRPCIACVVAPDLQTACRFCCNIVIVHAIAVHVNVLAVFAVAPDLQAACRFVST